MPTQSQNFIASNGRKIEIHQATYLMGLERGHIINDLIAKPHTNPRVQAALINIYSALAACSTGDVPTAQEFESMLDQDVEQWLRTASALNPHWFAWMEPAIKAIEAALTPDEQKKKDGRKRHKS
jgi:hypothetical protein